MKVASTPFNVNESKMYACHARVLAGLESLISVWARWPSGGSAPFSCALPFSAFQFSLPLAGDLRKSGSLYLRNTRDRGYWMRSPRLGGTGRAAIREPSAPKQCAARLIRASTVLAGKSRPTSHIEGYRGASCLYGGDMWGRRTQHLRQGSRGARHRPMV